MFGLGTTELVIVAGIILILFGHRLPSVMRSLGVGIKEFKTGLHTDPDHAEDKPAKEPSEQ